PRNPWLRVTLALAAWDAIEHIAILAVYLRSGQPGAAGLLAQGGALGGGLLLSRVDLQFGLSALEIVSLNLAFALQLGRTYDAWLARAFPHLPEPLLIQATSRLEELRLRAGERHEGQAERLYIVTRGSGALLRDGPGGHDILLRVL